MDYACHPTYRYLVFCVGVMLLIKISIKKISHMDLIKYGALATVAAYGADYFRKQQREKMSDLKPMPTGAISESPAPFSPVVSRVPSPVPISAPTVAASVTEEEQVVTLEPASVVDSEIQGIDQMQDEGTGTALTQAYEPLPSAPPSAGASPAVAPINPEAPEVHTYVPNTHHLESQIDPSRVIGPEAHEELPGWSGVSYASLDEMQSTGELENAAVFDQIIQSKQHDWAQFNDQTANPQLTQVGRALGPIPHQKA